MSNNSASFCLPVLPYGFDQLEPVIDTATMNIHYSKHHQAYIDKLNAAITANAPTASSTQAATQGSLIDWMASPVRAIKNNAGGHYNHCFFWQMMCTPGSGSHAGPTGAFKEALEQSFGSVDAFKKAFSDAAITQFGSGWAWLGIECSDSASGSAPEGKLAVCSTLNQDNPFIPGDASKRMIPVMTLDVWEHAYYLKYQNRRAEYVGEWWKVVNWDGIGQIYQDALSTGQPMMFEQKK